MTSVQLGMRNHQWVPLNIIIRIAKLKGGEAFKVLRKLLKNKFVVHTGKNYDGYKLTYLGYDYLALQTFIKRGILKDVISKIGVGKESDIYKCVTPQGEIVVLKLTRLGRNSFRNIKKNREYIGNRTNYNWLYLSRLSSIRQFLFMQLLNENNFTTPRPIDTNRHAIVMSLVEGSPLCHIQRFNSQQEIKRLFEKSRSMLIKFAQNGLIHGDYNEFNLMTNQEATLLTVIDFPQCISVNHPNAQTYFNRDVQCIYKFFDKMAQRKINDQTQNIIEGDLKKRKFILNVADYPMPALKEIEVIKRLDRELKTKGHITLIEEKELENAMNEYQLTEVNCNQNSKDEEQEQIDEAEEEQGEQEQEQKSKQNRQASLLGRQIKKMPFDQTEGEIQEIKKCDGEKQIQSEQVYDIELQALMSELNHSNLKPEFELNPLEKNPLENSSSDQQDEHPEFKGLTAYQIRQKIKAEKRLERQRRKKQMTEDEYIKSAIKKPKKKSKKGQAYQTLGNRGTKNKNRVNADNVRFGSQFM